ncbi:hypothetical protein G3T36_11385 [Diaminobutyricibacter tongyongensis]|uniref:Uncharacterized protein n=1 Tax=Leifsonia tongyongensis TaxID=1268043 RepID=A0A6L9XYG8_9MICO|nr:hypothetical protein [Diaminobutyricibacter tongyongensis]NEN06471.1 hypothetical protein [Diaminobutyricibacter tongyongensis]
MTAASDATAAPAPALVDAAPAPLTLVPLALIPLGDAAAAACDGDACTIPLP